MTWTEHGRKSVRRLATRVRRGAKAVRAGTGVEEVHDLRTSTRRLRTAITLHRWEASGKKRDEVEDELKRVTRRLGAVRDLDVLLETLAAAQTKGGRGRHAADVEPLRDAWRAERAAGARRLKAEVGRRRFRRTLKRAVRLVTDGREAAADSGPEIERVATRAPSLIWDAFGAVLAYEVDPKTADPADIHQLRIVAKKLRYTLEAFEDALEPGATLIEDVKALQDAAGSMHDAIVAADRARRAVRPHRLSRRQQRAIKAFADAQRRLAEGQRSAVAKRLRRVRSRAFRGSLGRAVAGIGRG